MADIYIHYGSALSQMTRELMAAANVDRLLKPDMRVFIKPNLVVSRPAEGGATTHPQIVEGIVLYLQEQGVRDITIAEGAWVGDSTNRGFKNCGYEALARERGVKLLDTKQDRCVAVTSNGIPLKICESPYNADFLINVPVLKGHCQTGMTCCIKNLKGIIPDDEKRRYHTMGLDRPIAALGCAVKPQLHIIDSVCGDLSFEEGGNPVPADRILLGFDAVLLDSYCAGLMGFLPEEIGYLKLAKDAGAGKFADSGTEVAELAANSRPTVSLARQGGLRKYAEHIDEDDACSACYAALVFALHKSRRKPGERIKIGQGFKGKSCNGFGVGSCTARCAGNVPGCPPSAAAILAALEK